MDVPLTMLRCQKMWKRGYNYMSPGKMGLPYPLFAIADEYG